jgi:hypothetical protein
LELVAIQADGSGKDGSSPITIFNRPLADKKFKLGHYPE